MIPHLDESVHAVEAEAKTHPISSRLLIDCIDLTELAAEASDHSITALCEQARSHAVAAVCVPAAFVSQAKKLLNGTGVRIATVANFPSGTASLAEVLNAIERSLQQGAEELDIVIPYQAYLENQNPQPIKHFVSACKALLPNQCLKIILESGAAYHHQLLEAAALASLEGGAQFLKTSTGKIAQGARLIDAAILLNAIQHFGDNSRGFKASGGVRQAIQAQQYYLLAQHIMGVDWPNKNTFRLGASKLLDDLLMAT